LQIVENTVQQIDRLDLDGWQSLLDRSAEVFSDINPGARIGVVSKDDFEPPTATMLVWEATDQGMRASYESFPGFERVAIDLLFIADDATIVRMHDSATPSPFVEIRGKLRRRDILLYVVKPRDALIEAGYENFLDSLGLAVLGACR
jgi:hypothetical protein